LESGLFNGLLPIQIEFFCPTYLAKVFGGHSLFPSRLRLVSCLEKPYNLNFRFMQDVVVVRTGSVQSAILDGRTRSSLSRDSQAGQRIRADRLTTKDTKAAKERAPFPVILVAPLRVRRPLAWPEKFV
jgi:hypothetical protein